MRYSKALTVIETLARYEVLLETYVKTINIELNVAKEMVEQSIIPAGIKYIGDLAKVNYYSEKSGALSSVAVKTQREVTETVDAISEKCEVLVANHKAAMANEEMLTKAENLFLVSKDDLAELRILVDKLEKLMPTKEWPMPSYTDLLFNL